MNTSFGQIYTYDAALCTKEKFKTAQFVESFSLDALPKDKITWINFYMYDDLAPIEAFCKKAKLDSLVFQNIRDRDYRPQFEDYDHYLFFSVRSATPSGTRCPASAANAASCSPVGANVRRTASSSPPMGRRD